MRGSGAKLSRSKTEAFKWREDGLFGTWVKKMKVLGVWFGTVSVEQDNWQPKINKFEKSITLCKSRSLSPLGKAMLINIISFSKFSTLLPFCYSLTGLFIVLIKLFGLFCGDYVSRPLLLIQVIVVCMMVGWALQILF